MVYLRTRSSSSASTDVKCKNKPIIVKRKYIKLNPSSTKKRTLTLQDIKSILSSSNNKKRRINKNELVYIDNKLYRECLYATAAEYIAAKEIESWPTYGCREWKCIVEINEDNERGDGSIEGEDSNNSDDIISPLFRLNGENFELACLSETLNDIPTMFSSNNSRKDKKKESNNNSSGSGCSINMENFIKRIWISPQLEHFEIRKNAVECAVELNLRENLIDRFLYGIGIRDKLLRPFRPTMEEALEVGLYRFQKDGLWVVGQEELWQEDRADFLGVRMPKSKANSHRRWCLDDSYQDLCYSYALQHYDSVMYTVKARSLYSELEHGFDVLRERGRGRYDMEIPAFDKPELSILTSNDAPWMPLIRTILGEEAVLIHKGCFLSLPGSETQVYHQDGVHLSKTHQLPCHAVNVFIPLVDLTSKNGPTEFCKGTHILSNENFQKQNIEIPLVEAGTPVIFDYRLGHRGLGNTTMNEVRPIIYLSYASSDFRDSVNFSRKRYVEIGEIINTPISRKERALQRALLKESLPSTEPDDQCDVSSPSTLVGMIRNREVKVSIKVDTFNVNKGKENQ